MIEPKKYYVHVIGCQQNEHDGVRLNYLFEKLGFAQSEPEDADVIVVVACSVRQTAVDRIYGNVRNWQKKSSHSNLQATDYKLPTILLTGCVLDTDKKKFAEKGIFFWDIEKPQDLAKLLKIKDKGIVEKLLAEGGNFSSSVPIMFGCNNFCTYCATAFTRGRERSRKIDDIINDVKTLIKKGKKEILLLGQTIDSYKDPETGARLDTLFHKLNDLPGDFRIAFTSNHPKDMTDEIIEAVANLPKIKKEIHLPLQSGSNKILKAMNRPYTAEEYLRLVEKVKLKVKNVELTTDTIVGFPGETEEDFQKTVDIVKSVRYATAYNNKYSPRPGTAAFKLGDPIPWSEKQRRWRILNDLTHKPKSSNKKTVD